MDYYEDHYTIKPKKITTGRNNYYMRPQQSSRTSKSKNITKESIGFLSLWMHEEEKIKKWCTRDIYPTAAE